MQDYEKLASFYLGRIHDPEGEEPGDLLLYDAKDLCTHAVCVGMTGSGKTGLCIGLLEEAALDGIPVIAIDPKGDMGNLMLTFPNLAASDFRPWVDGGEASRKGLSEDEFAESTAKLWKGGLADWGQDGERIQRLRDAAKVSIYTPGSTAGLPLTLLKSFAAPPPALANDAEALGDRVQSAVAGLLALVGVDADPVQSREFILLSNILRKAWIEGRDLEIADLIREIQSPPFEKLGVLDIESFFPSKDRFALAMRLNNLLASPGFASWLEGDPLDVQRLLYTPDGKPRISILSIAHLSEAERMFFVTTFLNEFVAWTRSQAGTSSLRAILYMDEIFGFFPPTAQPPSKRPMLTLLKQARAYGVGVVLATQNPVDLDYKGLANTGTWFIGRLQTERDKERVLDGLEGAMSGGGKSLDRRAMDKTLSALGKRVFLLSNVHDDHPVLFHTRWVMSYLRGPMTRQHIKKLMEPQRAARAQLAGSSATADRSVTGSAAAAASVAVAPKEPDSRVGGERPVLPDGINERYAKPNTALPEGAHWLYRGALSMECRLHYANSRLDLDYWTPVSVVAGLDPDDDEVDWDEATVVERKDVLETRKRGQKGARFAELPTEALRKSHYKKWASSLKRWLYENKALDMWKNTELKLVSEPGEAEGDFRVRVTQGAHERRDLELEKLRKKYAPKFERANERIRKAEARIEKEAEQVAQKKKESWISTGTSLLGALLGRKKLSSTNVGRLGTSARAHGRVAKEKGDVERARETLEAEKQKFADLEATMREAIESHEDKWHPSQLEVDDVLVRPRKTDINVPEPALVWLPWIVDEDGTAEPAFELE